MHLFLKPQNFIALKVFLIFALVVSFFSVEITPAHAAPIQQVQDYMSRIKAGAASNHDIRFKVTALHSTAIAIDFAFIVAVAAPTVVFGDIDLRYGSSQSEVNGITCSESATCRNATLATSAGASIWGASWAGKVLTLAYPTSGGTALAANDYVRILIGANAAFGVPGVNQLVNALTPGNSLVGTITLSPETGSFAVSLIPDEQIQISAKIAETMTFSFLPEITSGISVSGNDCGVGGATVGTNSLNFGSLSPSSPKWGCYKFTASTNASGGLQVTLTQDRDLTSTGGQNINAFKDGVTSTPLAWGPPAGTLGVDTTYGHMGISSNDTAAENSAYTSSRFVGFLSYPFFREIFFVTSPINSTTKNAIFKIETSALQEAGTYTNTVTAIATGKF